MALKVTNFLGRGFAYPMVPDNATGDLKGAAEAENIKGCILLFLDTVQGERVLNEGFGMPRVLFEEMTVGTADIIRDAAFQGLAKYEPRIRVLAVDVQTTQSQSGLSGVRVLIRYRIRSTNKEDNVVYEPLSDTLGVER